MLPFLVADRNLSGELEAPARALGQAMQITNVVRDVGEDWRKLGRVYLPQDEMERAGIAEVSFSGYALSSLTKQGYVETAASSRAFYLSPSVCPSPRSTCSAGRWMASQTNMCWRLARRKQRWK